MGIAVPMVIMTLFWAIVGGVLPWVIPKNSNRGIIQTMLVLTAACCYLFWLCTILMQVYPLFGPQIDNNTLLMMQHQWG